MTENRNSKPIMKQPPNGGCLEKNDNKIKSDGLSSDYYKIYIPDEVLETIIQRKKDWGESYIQTNEIIRFALNNDFDMGNIFKCMVRVTSLLNGKGKYGADLSYDINKINWSANQMKINLKFLGGKNA